MLEYYDKVKNKNKTKNKYIVLKEVYNICISAINIFRPICAMEVYDKYKSERVLDFCAGWGGRLVGACALNLKKYIGIEINTLEQVKWLDTVTFGMADALTLSAKYVFSIENPNRLEGYDIGIGYDF
jgi:hypothetical protein